MHPGNRLRELRKAAGLTQIELAARTGVTQSSISQIENGNMPLTVEWMRAFAREIGCAPSDLLVDADIPDRLSEEERLLVAAYRNSPPEARVFLRTSASAVADNANAYKSFPKAVNG